jgi:purine-nucleoside/S-methyl-5'-thioadenosine phosphorylase / adenosine deaminase
MVAMAIANKQESDLRKLDELLAKGGVERRARRTRLSRIGKNTLIAENSGFEKAQKGVRPKKLEILRAPALTGSGFAAEWMVHGFSSRTGGLSTVYTAGAKSGGDLNLGFTASDDAARVIGNRKIFLKAVYCGNGDPALATLKQIHSALIRRVDSGEDPATPSSLKGDGLMTDTPGLLLGIQTADCIPVLVADIKNRAVAAFHAGWRGTLRRIVENGIGRMRLEFGSRPEDMVAVIGPGIGLCCYAVGEEVQQEFESQFPYAADLFREVDDSDPIKEKYPLLFLTARAPGHSNLGPSLHLDLTEANRRQLLSAGLRSSAVHLVKECTGCHTERFFSHRTEQGFTGRMMSVIGIRV